ncbi:MAG: hypothetical protein Kow00127_20300 [Bacteroidales bacterium]
MIIVNHINNRLLITFDYFVESGHIRVLSGDKLPLATHHFHHSNFETVKLQEIPEKFILCIDYDKKRYQRKFRIQKTKTDET